MREHLSPHKILGYKHLKFHISLLKTNEIIHKVCSNSTTIGAGPHVSTLLFGMFDAGVTADFVCNGTAKSHSR